MPDAKSKRVVLIFGGAGFIGSNWANHLLTHTDARVHIFDNLSREGVRHNLTCLQDLAGDSDRLQITFGDVRNAAAVEQAARTASEIYHFAAQVAVTTSVTDPRRDFEINLAGTFNVLEGARHNGRKPFLLFTSTNKVYGNIANCRTALRAQRWEFIDYPAGIGEEQPLDFHSPYGCSKGGSEQYVRDYARIYGLPTVVLRMSCIAGPRQFGNEDQGWVAHFLYSALGGNPVAIYGDGYQVRDVLNVADLLRVFDAVRERSETTAGEIYNVGGGPANGVSLLELLQMVEEVMGVGVLRRHEPARPGDQRVYVTDTSKLRRHTGWEPHCTVRDTLAAIYHWWKQNRSALPGWSPQGSEHSPAIVPAPPPNRQTVEAVA
jgi:CDP-paratose 2-epimerase